MTTTTVRVSAPVPVERLTEAATAVHSISVQAPVHIGQVLLTSLLDLPDVNVVACRDIPLQGPDGGALGVPAPRIKRHTKPSEAPLRSYDVVIVYGSQTGNAEQAAYAVASELSLLEHKAKVVDASDVAVEDLDELQSLVIVTSTAGDGDFPDNFESFWKQLQAKKKLKIKFTCFGLGSSEYAKYQAAVRSVHKHLVSIGCQSIHPLGEGDDKAEGGWHAALDQWMSELGSSLQSAGVSASGAAGDSDADIVDIEDLPACYKKPAGEQCHTAAPTYSILDGPDQWMNVVISRDELPSVLKGNPSSLVELRVVCPPIAASVQPGQFVMVRVNDKSERVPLAVIDWSASEGWISFLVQPIGSSSTQVSQLSPGRRLLDIAGPMGTPSQTPQPPTPPQEPYDGKSAVREISRQRPPVLFVASGVIGAAKLLPVAKAQVNAGWPLTAILSLRSGASMPAALVDRWAAISTNLTIVTGDGAFGVQASDPVDLVKSTINASHPLRVVVAGDAEAMSRICTATKLAKIETAAHMASVMVDGTGICGGCRVKVGNEWRLSCTDGPEVDGLLVDWKAAILREKSYEKHERIAVKTPKMADAVLTKRVPMPAQDPHYRRLNWDESSLGFTPAMAVAEASRCLQCKDPGCQVGCPVSTDVKGFVALIKRRQFSAAARHIRRHGHPLPSVCGRVCPQESQCEGNCELNKAEYGGQPLAIGALERFCADWEAAHPIDQDVEGEGQGDGLGDPSLSGRRVAIIGAGPAGLSCALDLLSVGVRPTVFEQLSTPGGLMVYGIPSFCLPRDTISTSWTQATAAGVELRLNTPVGRDGAVSMKQLMESYAAVFVGAGAGKPLFLGIPGEELSGVYASNEFLLRVNLLNAHRFPHYGTPILVAEDVVVLGGGNTAIDAARCAVRLGAKRVSIVYRRSRSEMPARRAGIEEAEEEGITIHELASPVRIHGDGQVSAVEVQQMKLGKPDASGRARPEPDTSVDTYRIPAQECVMAIGQGAMPWLLKDLPELKTDARGMLAVDDHMHTSVKGVFAGGDAATGPATVVRALGGGRAAAKGIVAYLKSK